MAMAMAMKSSSSSSSWKRRELVFLILYALSFYVFVIIRSLRISSEHYGRVYGLRLGWIRGWLNDISDAQWRNFRGNLPILTVVYVLFTMIAYILRARCQLKAWGMSLVWLLLSSVYLSYLHGACIIFILGIAGTNYLLVKIFGQKKYFLFVLWVFNLAVLVLNRVYGGYRFSDFGQHLAYLDNYRGTFRWHICFNFVSLRLISFGCDYHWAHCSSRLDQKKHMQTCPKCSSGQTCFLLLQERNLQNKHFSFSIYLSYLTYAPLYIAGPVITFNEFASQLDTPQKNYSLKAVALYGVRWIFCLFLIELMTHLFYYNAFATSDSWKQLSPMDIFIIGYGVLNFMWLKFLLIWRYFRFWSLISGIDAPENMPRCINNCHNLEGFWKSWHASFNKWLVRYMYIPLGGSRTKLLNVWVIFSFVAIWHDLEWKLLSWAWLTCLVFVPEMIVKSTANSFQVKSSSGKWVLYELRAVAGSITITCLMVANLVGYVIGPSGLNWLMNRFFRKEGLPTLCGMLVTFYVGTKLMIHIADSKQRRD